MLNLVNFYGMWVSFKVLVKCLKLDLKSCMSQVHKNFPLMSVQNQTQSTSSRISYQTENSRKFMCSAEKKTCLNKISYL